jgi:hypothetical protein
MSLNDPNVKKVTITSEAAQSLSPKVYEEMAGGEKAKTRKRKSSKKVFTGGDELIVNKLEKEKEKENEKVGGGGTSPGTLDQLASSHVPGSNSSKAVGIASRFTADSAPVGKIAPSSGSELTGGGAKVKVVLSKTHKKSKVILGPAKAKTSINANSQSKYKKTVKKLNVSLTGLTRKLHKAKRIHSGVRKQSIEEVKKALEKAGLIKDDSKAPEDILRRMYSDYMVLKNRAL